MPIKKKWILVGLCTLSALFIVLLTCLARFSWSAICDKCGAEKDTTAWQVRSTEFTVFHSATERETPVSRALSVGPHSHHWIFAQGGGNGVRCALGSAHMVQFTVASHEVARLIEALNKYGEKSFEDKLLTNLFNDETTFLVRTLPVTANGFTNASELHIWIAEHEPDLDESVKAFQSRH